MRPHRRCVRASSLRIPRSLAFDGNDIGHAGLAALFAQPAIENLETLDAASFRVHDAGLRAIAQCARLTGLRKLTVNHGGFTDDGIRSLAATITAIAIRTGGVVYDPAIHPDRDED